MTTNWQFTSLKTSKRLAELGVKSESMMYWIEQSDGCVVNRSLAMYEENGCDLKILWGKFTPYQDYKKYSAFSPSELGEILPDGTTVEKRYTTETTNPDSNKVEYFESWCPSYPERGFEAETMAEAMGLMLEYLIKNKLI